MFFVTRIFRASGSAAGLAAKRFLKTAVKMARTKNKLKFLLNCRRCKIVPKCLDYRMNVVLENPVSLYELSNLEKRQKIRVLSIAVDDTIRSLEWLRKDKQYWANQVMDLLGEETGQDVWRLVENKVQNAYNISKEKGIRKLERLKSQNVQAMATKPEWIENTTNVSLPECLERTLLLGPNFNIQHKNNIPYIRFVADVEAAIDGHQEAEAVRADVSTMVSNHINYMQQPHTKRNEWIHQDIINTKSFLKEHPDIYITKADKGKKTVVMLAEEYRQKMHALVSDTTTYKQINQDPTKSVLKTLNGLVEKWWQDGHIDKPTRDKLLIYNCNPPKIYGLPKLHKEGRPLRPVVSTIGSATYRVAQFLAGILKKVVGKTEYHVRNSFDFAEDVAKVRVPENNILYSLDVVSLYTNVPIKQIMRCVREKKWEIMKYTTIPWSDFKNAMRTVLESSIFQYDNKLYEQIFGVPMGSPLSPVGSDIVMEKLERTTMEKLKERNVHITWYQRYVDDCLVVGKEEDIAVVLEEFNSYHETLQFTLEREENCKIRFLDMTLERVGEKISKRWFPKQKNGRYLDFNSESPFTHKKNTAIALFDRALALTDSDKRKDSLLTAVEILRGNNYPTCFIQRLQKQRVERLYNSLQWEERREERIVYASLAYIPGLGEKVGKVLRKHGVAAAFKPTDKIKDTIFTKLKDKTPKMRQTNVVYSVPCGGCGKQYIGQTSQFLEKRLRQHEASVRSNAQISGITQHVSENGHLFNFACTKILDKVEKTKNRLFAEKLHIKLRGEDSVNLQRESAGLSNVYAGVLRKLHVARNLKTKASTEERAEQEEEYF